MIFPKPAGRTCVPADILTVHMPPQLFTVKADVVAVVAEDVAIGIAIPRRSTLPVLSIDTIIGGKLPCGTPGMFCDKLACGAAGTPSGEIGL